MAGELLLGAPSLPYTEQFISSEKTSLQQWRIQSGK